MSGVVSVLEVERPDGTERPEPTTHGRRGLGRYASLLPGGPLDGRISLGEGDSPLVRSRAVGPRLAGSGVQMEPDLEAVDRYLERMGLGGRRG
jgi:hypothetical protein